MIGAKLSDRYEITSELGRGGMGVVYQAHDPLLNRDVAIKLTHQTLMTPEAMARFRAEAQTVAKMDHPSIVPIHDIGEYEGALFFVMPVLAGKSLRHVLRDQTLTLGDIIEGGIQVATALDYSHGHEVLHRDIKPENLMVSVEGGRLRFRVMDFGLARDTTLSRMTKSGILVGTMSYMSPEQVSGKPCDGRSDIYSLGTVLYECVTGDTPFGGEMQSVLYRIVHEIPQPPRSLGLELDDELESIVMRCLEKDPEKRPQKGSDLAELLRRYQVKHRESEQMKTIVVSRSEVTPRPALAPFVGREAEMKELQMRLHAAKSGECQLVVLSGDAGIGKTRLLDELETLARAQQIKVLHGRFMEQDGAFPYHGFCELIQDFFRQKESGSSSAALPDLTDISNDLVSLFPMLGEVEEIRSSSSQSIPVSGEARTLENRNQIFELLARTITRLAAGRPIVLSLEDLHGAEVSIEALQYIVRRLGPTPTLILATYRPAEMVKGSPLARMIDGFRGDPRFAALSLESLSEGEHKKLLSTLLGGQEADERLARQIYESSEGNPFFAKELIRSLLDSGNIVQESTGIWALSGGAEISSDELPATIQEAVEKRIGDLPDDLIQILSVAAVMGKSFDYEDLEALAVDEGDLDSVVDRLVQQGIIEEERRSRTDVLSFSSGVMREVLYAKLTRRKRRSLHRKFAQLLEENHSGRLERVYPQLVYHFSEGDVPEKTVEYGLLHARKSLESWSPEEVIRSANTALEFLDEEWEGDPATPGEVRLVLASGHEMGGDLTSALRDVEGAIQVFERAGKTERAVQSMLIAAQMAWQARRTAETSRWVDRGIQAARDADEPRSLADFLSLAATLANLRAEYAKANEYLHEAERLRGRESEVIPRQEVPSGGTVIVGLSADVESIDPAGTAYDSEVEISANVFETLIATDEAGRLVPNLCKDWTVGDEGKTIRFTLRNDVQFHDGSPLNAREIKRSFEQSIRIQGKRTRGSLSSIAGAQAFQAGEADDVSGIVASSEGELEIHLDQALPIYPALLTENHTAVAKAGSGEENARTVGHVILAATEKHWRIPPKIDRLEFRGGFTGSSMAEALRAGKVDIARNLLSQDLEDVQREPRFRGRMVEAAGKHTFFALMNTKSGPVAKHPVVRQALASVVRVRDLVWHSMGRLAEPAASLISPGLLGHDPGRRRQHRSPEKAKELLKSAGFDGPVKLQISCHPASQDRYRDLLKDLFSMWKEIGVEAEIATTTPESYDEKTLNPEGIDIQLIGWMSDYDDPDAFTHHLFDSQTGHYRIFFSSDAADEILQKARSESAPEIRTGLYRKFETLIEDEAALLPLFHEIHYRLPGPRVRNLKMGNSPPYTNYAEVGKGEEEVSSSEISVTEGGTVRVPMLRITKTLDPTLVTMVVEAEVQSVLFETLTRVGEGAQIVPWLASTFDVEDGGKRYRFRLRDDVRFHDGRRLTARDVRFTFERCLQSPQSEFRLMLSVIRGARALMSGEARELDGFQIHSASEFTIDLERPFSFFPTVLTHLSLAILPEGIDMSAQSWRDGCVGTGPYRVVRFDPGRRVEFERNPGYWRTGYPRSERLTFEHVSQPEDIYSGFVKGEYSVASDLLPHQFEELRRDPKFASGYRETPSLMTTVLALNARKGPLQDRELRRRVIQSISLEDLIRGAKGVKRVPAGGIIPPGLLGHSPTPIRSTSRAEALPGKADSEMELTFTHPPTLAHAAPEFVSNLTDALQRGGIRLRITTKTSEEYDEASIKGTTDLALVNWSADYPDAHAMVYGLVDSREGTLRNFCGTEELDALIDKAQIEGDPSVRRNLYREIEEKVAEEAFILPLFYAQIYRFSRPEVDGLTLTFSNPYVRLEELRVRG
jgi:ABC-type transport system substrate-binding protein/serine/threonine protein kinase